MRDLLVAIRRYTWMTELVSMLILLLVYRFTWNETVLIFVLLWPVFTMASMVGLTLAIDEQELSAVGSPLYPNEDGEFHDAS